MMRGSAALGMDWTRVATYKQYLEEAVFEDVVEKRYAWPLGAWAKSEKMKRLGELFREDLRGLLSSFSTAVMMKGLGMGVEEVKGFLEGVKEMVVIGFMFMCLCELAPRIIVCVMAMLTVYRVVVYGRKPRQSRRTWVFNLIRRMQAPLSKGKGEYLPVNHRR
jgi:hypothetical protein